MINVGAMIINENAINVLYTVPASVEKYAAGSVLFEKLESLLGYL